MDTDNVYHKCSKCHKIANIVRGFGKLAYTRIFGDKPPAFAIDRGNICRQCEYRTWLNVMEWGESYLVDITKDLPINHTPGKWDVLWCSKCKCCIEAKILLEYEKCPLDKWKVEVDDTQKQNKD